VSLSHPFTFFEVASAPEEFVFVDSKFNMFSDDLQSAALSSEVALLCS